MWSTNREVKVSGWLIWRQHMRRSKDSQHTHLADPLRSAFKTNSDFLTIISHFVFLPKCEGLHRASLGSGLKSISCSIDKVSDCSDIWWTTKFFDRWWKYHKMLIKKFCVSYKREAWVIGRAEYQIKSSFFQRVKKDGTSIRKHHSAHYWVMDARKKFSKQSRS